MRLRKLSEKFELNVIEITAGRLSPSELEQLLNNFNKCLKKIYFTSSSESNLLRIIEGMFNKSFFFRECLKFPHYLEVLFSISAYSNYLTDILVLHPEYFYWVVNPSVLTKQISGDGLNADINNAVGHLRTFKSKVIALKHIKQKEILKIGLRDIFEKIPLPDITKELSVLARTLASKLFSICYDEVLQKYGIDSIKSKFVLVSLGKLGGNELNYSSDIDLILFYDRDVFIRRKIYYSQILTEAAQMFITSSTESAGGALYRIDFRLRPDGKSAPLCRSVHDYLNYYESRGENWERQMLIKASFLCGSIKLYKNFINYLTPFIYPFSLKTSPKTFILKIKQNIERRIATEENIKLSTGGIRDIEFSVQALQLLNGGKNTSLQTGNTLTAINILTKLNLLNENEREILKKDYILYRRIEHFLQLMNDRQTHLIPAAGEIVEKLSFYLGFNHLKEFKKDLENSKKEIRYIYNSILAEDTIESKNTFDFNVINFKNISKALKDLQFLRTGKSILGERTFDTKSIENFKHIEPEIFSFLTSVNNPDKLLSNFVRIIRHTVFPSIWYAELQDEKFLNYFLTVCAFNQYAVDLFAEDKNLLEFFLSRKVFMKIPQSELIEFSIKKIMFYFSVIVINKIIPPIKASEKLSVLLTKKVKQISDKFAGNKTWKNRYLILEFGSIGSNEFSFASDIDIIFIVKNISKFDSIQEDFQEFLRLLRNELKPIAIDCRLRPEGKSSQLVWDLDEYNNYFEKRARIWEFQTLTKVNFAGGSKNIFNYLIKSISENLTKLKCADLKREFTGMRKKIVHQKFSHSVKIFDIKKSSGGITDIDFVVQYEILCKPAVLFKYCKGKNTIEKINLISNNKKDKTAINFLIDAFTFLKEIEIYNQLIFNITNTKISLDAEKITDLAFILEYESPENFLDQLKSISIQTGKIFREYFN